MQNTYKPKILIIEDEDAIRQGLCDVFVYHGYEVDHASEGRSGLKKAQRGRYHLILLDIMLPEIDGFTICQKIREQDRALPIIMLTAKGDEQEIIHGLKSGADDYVTKPFSLKELLARVEAVLRRSPKLQQDQAKINFEQLEIDPKNLTLKIHGKNYELSRREIDLLRYLIQHFDRAVPRQELLKEVWGYGNIYMETRTVDIHVAKLRRKIEIDPQNPQILQTIRGEGYKIGKV